MDKILIIDDEQTVVDALSEALESLPFKVLTTQDPEEGLQLFHDQSPFLVIVDLQMEPMSGLDFVKYLIQYEVPNHQYKSLHSDSSEVNLNSLKDADFFVIVLTGFGSKETMHTFTSLGVEYFLNKPIHIQTLKGIINSLHRLKTTKDELYKLLSDS